MKENGKMKGNGEGRGFFNGRSPWINNEGGIWLGSSVSLMRNIEKFKFPSKLSTDKKKQVISLIGKELLPASPLLKNPKLIKAEEIGLSERDFFPEHFLTNLNFQHMQPGEGFVIDDTGEFLAAVNLKDHIQFEMLDTRGDPESAWERLVKIEMFLGKSIKYSFSPRFGFLTADFTECGTGLVVRIFLQLTGLILTNQLNDAISKYKDEGIATTGLQGDPNEPIGDVLVISNQYTLGLTEEAIISGLRTFATKLIVYEKGVRLQIKNGDNEDVKDKVSRAYALLAHSYKTDTVEALNAVSAIKLGLDLGWVSGVSVAALNELFFTCRRAHLMSRYKEKPHQEEIPHRRAEFIREVLKDLHLHI